MDSKSGDFMKGALLVSHGSRSPQARKEVEALAAQLKAASGLGVFELGFLEIEKPTVSEGLETCVAQGATSVAVLLNFLNSGTHTTQHIPALVQEARAQYPEVTFQLSTPIGLHPDFPQLFQEWLS